MSMLNIGKFPWSVICFQPVFNTQNHSLWNKLKKYQFSESPIHFQSQSVKHYITISSELELQTLGDQSISSRDLSTLEEKKKKDD